MLTTLRIKNLALVADLTLELQPGYNVITGETGAGKSILIGALNLALGERADRTLIRRGSDHCSVEAVFEITRLQAPVNDFLEENGLEACEENQLVLKRAFTLSGANRQFVNGSPTSLSTLATLGEWLVDIHGPHEHQSLLRPASQLAMLDAFGKLEPERDAFGQLLRRRAALEQEKAALIVDEKTYTQQLDLLRFQTAEISGARLQPDEEVQLEQEFRRAGNVAKLMQLSQTALELLSENETSLLAQAGIVGRTLQELQRIDAGASSLSQLHDQSVAALRELQGELSRYMDRLEVDPARLQQLEERLNLLQSLKRKYGPSLAEVIAFGGEAQRKLKSLETRDAELARLNAALEELDCELLRTGQSLSARRKKLAPTLAKAIAKQLMDLGFKQSRFDLSLGNIDRTEPSRNSSKTAAAGQGSRNDSAEPGQLASPSGRWVLSGFDTVEFLFAPNPGEPPRPLRAIASSGELARVMLAIKTVLAAEDKIPVLVFDEVDANVGGETANAVGEKMQQIARQRQVLCITHLPQVAAPAAAHFVASKQVTAGRTISEISLLGPEDRVTELARMLGGQSEAARKHAEALLR
jgi:DNA repair protein RecN (Recombination protein N)